MSNQHRPGVRRARLALPGVIALVAASSTVVSAAESPATEPPGGTGASDGTTDAAWAEIVAAAEEEGSVVLYSSQGLPELEDLEDRFEAAYDIDLQVVRGLPQDLVPRLEVENQTGAGEADVYVSADQQWVVQANADGYYVPTLGLSFDDPGYDRAGGVPEGTYFKSNAVIFGYGWNTDEVPDGLSGYEDLLAPELEGRVGVVEAANQTLVDFYVYLEENLGEDFVPALAAQDPNIYPTAASINEALASGEIAAAVYTGASITQQQEAGAPVDFQYPEGAVFGAVFWGGVLASAPHPNAGQVLADFMVTVDGQEALARLGASVLPGIEGTEAVIGDVREQDLDLLTPEFVQGYIEEWRELFQ